MGKPPRPVVHARAFVGKASAPPAGPKPASAAGRSGGGKKRPAPNADAPTSGSNKRAKQQQQQQQQPQDGPARAANPPPQQQQHHHHQQQQWRASTVIDQQAASILHRLLEAARTRRGGATVKSLCLREGVRCKGATYAVTCETLKHLPALRAAVAREGLVEKHAPHLGEALAYVLAYEALLGQGLPGAAGSGDGGGDGPAAATAADDKQKQQQHKQQSRHRAGPAENAVRRALPGLRKAMADLQREAGASSVLDLASRLAGGGGGGAGAAAATTGAADEQGQQRQGRQHEQQHEQQKQQHWRAVRVNTLKIPTVERALLELGPALLRGARRDPLLPELLLLPPGTDVHAHPLVRSGALVLQGRSSCLPARALAPRAGWTCLDACAAPGNKTTHLAALVGARGRVLAFDRDERRLGLLRRGVSRAGAEAIVEPRCADFLALDPGAPEYARVRGVLLDPSCSGSGTAAARQLAGGGLAPGGGGGAARRGPEGGATTATEEEGRGQGQERGDLQQLLPPEERARVEQLARFQAAALRHALRFPAAERVTYSTCSVHARENEGVVAEVLEEAEAVGWRLADPFPAMGEGGGGGRGGEGPPGDEAAGASGKEVDGGKALGVAPMYGRRGWPHPGIPPGQERLLVRTDAALDGTDGFFVALFARERPPPPSSLSGGSAERETKKKKRHPAAEH